MKTVLTRFVLAKLFLLYWKDAFHDFAVADRDLNMKIIFILLKIYIAMPWIFFKCSEFLQLRENRLHETP